MKRVKKIVFVIISILLSLILIYNVYNFISIKVLHKDLASVNGYAILEVVSGSMEPTIHKGDIIIINTKEKNYKENDIITFKGNEGEFVTHRIKKIDNQIMITKGDNNNTEDAPIEVNSVVGKYISKINGGGKILSSFKNPFTMIMIFIIGLLACILLSTDKDGKPILEQDEKEFQEFLKSRNESIKEESKKLAKETAKKKEDNTKKEIKKSSLTKNKTNSASKGDTKDKKSSTKKINESKDKQTKNKTTGKQNTAEKINTQTKSVKDKQTLETKKSVSNKVGVKKTTIAKKPTIKTKTANVKKDAPKKEVLKKSTPKKADSVKATTIKNAKKTATKNSKK